MFKRLSGIKAGRVSPDLIPLNFVKYTRKHLAKHYPVKSYDVFSILQLILIKVLDISAKSHIIYI